jgi:hypothetical protein
LHREKIYGIEKMVYEKKAKGKGPII